MVSHLARLCEISITLNSTLNISSMLEYIMETTAEVLDCEAASIMLYDENKGRLVFAASTGSDPAVLEKIHVPLKGSIAGTIFRENKPLRINDVESDPRHFQKVGEKVQFRPRQIVGVPMTMRDKVIGVLEALNKNRGHFSLRDQRLLAIIASQAAVAISNARMHNALREAYDNLSKTEKLKSDFMAIASHELRTPLGIILGYASFLREETQDDLSEHADMVLNSALRLRAIVEDMTNMNLLEAGTLGVNTYLHPLNTIITGAHEEIAPTATAKGQTLTINKAGIGVMVNADPAKLELVLVNVLTNAVRFTPPNGNIELSVETTPHEVNIYITDDGVGIPKNQLTNIFDQFYQVEDHMTRKQGGLGLGLSIARGIVRAHGGKIWAESEGYQKGTRITISLPLADETTA